MSLDLTVITRDRISGETSDNLYKLLAKSGFKKDEFGFTSIDDGINVNLYVHNKFDDDHFWDPGEVKAIGFEPESEIIIESFHTEKSHQKAYRTALVLAKVLNGAIYDHQVGVFYKPNGLDKALPLKTSKLTKMRRRTGGSFFTMCFTLLTLSSKI